MVILRHCPPRSFISDDYHIFTINTMASCASVVINETTTIHDALPVKLLAILS